MMSISANLGFLLRDLPLPDAVRRARELGFSAVECHWPFEVAPAAVSAALAETGLPMLALNTSRGDVAKGDFGTAAIPDRRGEARAAIDQAIEYAAAIGCRNVHVMAGRGEGTEAFRAYVENLSYAAARAAPAGIGILIEPLNARDAPGYFLTDMKRARDVVTAVGSASVGVMFDCYHMQIMRGDLTETVREMLPLIRHVQFAAVPDRGEPDHGEIDYSWLLPALRRLGYAGWFGAEYRPKSGSFDWLRGLAAAVGPSPPLASR
jgi:hydroxypyruvate isomerase